MAAPLTVCESQTHTLEEYQSRLAPLVARGRSGLVEVVRTEDAVRTKDMHLRVDNGTHIHPSG